MMSRIGSGRVKSSQLTKLKMKNLWKMNHLENIVGPFLAVLKWEDKEHARTRNSRQIVVVVQVKTWQKQWAVANQTLACEKGPVWTYKIFAEKSSITQQKNRPGKFPENSLRRLSIITILLQSWNFQKVGLIKILNEFHMFFGLIERGIDMHLL